jgi:hypothetical protein
MVAAQAGSSEILAGVSILITLSLNIYHSGTKTVNLFDIFHTKNKSLDLHISKFASFNNISKDIPKVCKNLIKIVKKQILNKVSQNLNLKKILFQLSCNQ